MTDGAGVSIDNAQWQIVITVQHVINRLIREWMCGFIVPEQMIQFIRLSMK
jgi:hypothetical protein